MRRKTIKPDWAVHPVENLNDWMEANPGVWMDGGKTCNQVRQQFMWLMDNHEDERAAEFAARVTGGYPEHLWRNLIRNYRHDKRWGPWRRFFRRLMPWRWAWFD